MQLQAASIHAALAVLASALVVSACGGEGQQAAGPGGAMPPPTVGVVAAVGQSVPMVTELPGRTTAFLIAEVRPQVSGIVARRTYVEGTDVKAGATLYEIAPATYAAVYDSAKASLARASANLDAARVRAQRNAELLKIDAVSRQTTATVDAVFE